MNQGLARYHARSPRYYLNTDDDSLVRVAGPRQTPWEEGTEIRNVSLTGLAFTAPADLCPLLGEVIRIQFMIPGGRQTACHAIVIRLEEDRPGTMVVAVHFYKLEMAHRIILAQGLAKRFREQMGRKRPQDQILSGTNPWGAFGAFAALFVSLWFWAILAFSMTSWGTDGLLQVLLSYFR